MTTNHPAHGPVSLDRLHQISEILSKAAAQSDGGNLGYAMADAVKVIEGAIAARNVETIYQVMYGECWRDITEEQYHDHAIHESPIRIVYTAPPAQLVPEEVSWEDVPEEITEDNMEVALAWAHGFNHCRAAMLQAGNPPATPDCSCRTCRPVTFTDSRFVVCPECGNKRCPHANDHRNACTGSNEPGQAGSAYPAAPQQEVKNV
ncbi:hypothetical protein OLN68_09635 [Citrobacter freundii]|nr:hypothetical protein [Citrobacter freundii]MCW1445914.1 hypothetical protein [Citrobacter freundii]